MPQRHGFTLIEFVIVIVLIFILTGTVIPAVMQLHGRPRDTMCLQNQTSIWKALALYAEDWEGHIPMGLTKRDSSQAGQPIVPSGGDHTTTWNQSLCIYPASMLNENPDYAENGNPHWQAPRGYLQSPETFECPSSDPAYDVSRFADEAYGLRDSLWWRQVQGAYGLNYRMSAWRYPDFKGIAQPADCYLFADSWIWAFDHVCPSDRWYAPRHGSAGDIVNIMFADGHSESVIEAEILMVDDVINPANPNYTGRYGEATPWWGGTADESGE